MEARQASLKETKKTPSRSSVDLSSVSVPFMVAGSVVVLIILLYYSTFHSMVSIWMSSGTYAHGFFILPISLYLIWDERERLAGARAQPTYVAMLGLVGLGFFWLICHLIGVNVLEQYAAVTVLIVAVWAILGHDLTKRVLFPLGFLLLSVPIGDALLPALIDQTAEFTVAALRLSGVAVFQDGNSLTLATGRWSVVEACSGLRYLIASVTLGFLYAHLSYRSWWRRGLCILASVIVPIVANWLRAYMIVMIGHLSDMQLAVGIDHLIYGWLFFGVVILVFFWVGSFFREDLEARTDDFVDPPADAGAPVKKLVAAATMVVLVAMVWPVWASRVEQAPAFLPSGIGSPLPARLGSFARHDDDLGWEPYYEGPDVEFLHAYRGDRGQIGVHVACYLHQTQGHELVSSINRFVPSDEWRKLEEGPEVISLSDREHPVLAARLEGPLRVVAWKWFWIQGTSTASALEAKRRELTGKLLDRSPTACGVTVFVPHGNQARAREQLTGFLDDGILSELEASLGGLPRVE